MSRITMKWQHMNEDTKKVFRMSIPIFIELMLQLLVGNIDQIMIGKYQQELVTAIGNGNQIMNILIMILTVFSMATTIEMTKNLGANNKLYLRKIQTVSIALITVLSLVITAFILIFNQKIFTLMHVPSSVFDSACQYLMIVASFILVTGLYLNLTAMLRSNGYLTQVMIVSVIMNVCNIIGNAILIYGLFGFPQLGLLGVAISTVASKCLGLVLICFIYYKKVKDRFSIRLLKPFPKDALKRILRIGLPQGIEELSYNGTQIVILSFINLFGIYVVNTKQYSSILANVAYVYSMAIAQATQIMIGYLIGSRKLHKIEERVWGAIKISLLVSLTVTIIMYFNSDFVFGIFTSNEEILRLGKQILFVEFFLEIGRSMNIMLGKALIAAGDVKVPMIISTICMWTLAVGLSYVFGVYFNLGLVGIWIAMAIDEGVRAVLLGIRFTSGRWKDMQ